MTLKSILVVVLLTVQGQIFAQEPDQYIGKVDPPIPAGCKDLGGGLVIRKENGEIGFKAIFCKDHSLFWLQEQVDKWPSLKWRVLDVLTIPHPRDGRSILTPEDGCSYESSDAAWIIAIGRWIEEKVGGHATDIERAWIISNNEKRFKQIVASKVTCAHSEDRD